MRTVSALAVVVLLAPSLGCEGRMLQFQIPSGYVGWVEIEYGNPGCPPAPRENGWLLLISGHDGRGCVRESPAGTWLRKKYRYDDPARTELAAGDIRREGYKIEDRNGHEAGRAFVFFVGKESDIKSGGGRVPGRGENENGAFFRLDNHQPVALPGDDRRNTPWTRVPRS